MVPYGLTQAQFQAMYRRKLDGLSKHAIAHISALLSMPVAPDVDEAHVEVFPGEDGNEELFNGRRSISHACCW